MPTRHAIDGRRVALGPPRRVALHRAGAVEQLEAHTLLGGRRRELAGERGNDLAARVEEGAELPSQHAGGLVMADLRGRLRVVALQRPLDLRGRAPLQLGGIRTVPCRSRQAVVAEAEPEQQPRRGTELDEVALVVGAMLERVVVQRLAEHGADATGRDVSGERERVGAHAGVARGTARSGRDRRSTSARRSADRRPRSSRRAGRPSTPARSDRAHRRRRRGRRGDRAAAVSALGRGWIARPRQRAGSGRKKTCPPGW